jgi:hypothetical protein
MHVSVSFGGYIEHIKLQDSFGVLVLEVSLFRPKDLSKHYVP